MKIQRTLTGLALFGLIASSSVFAADSPVPTPVGPLAQACHTDVQTYCPAIQPGEGRIMSCMKKHMSKISEGCKAAVKEAQAKKKPKAASAAG